MTKRIMITVPAYAGTVHLGTMRSLLADVLALASRGDLVSIYDESGSAMIADARAQMLAHFMASDATHLVMVDHDVMWEPRGLVRLVDHPHDFVAGAYPRRVDPIDFAVLLEDGNPVDTQTGLVEVKGVAAGFMRLTRAAIEKMQKRYPDLAYVADKFPERTAYDLFSSVRDPDNPRRKLGEDYSFCQRWRDIGGRIWIDPGILMGHVGPKVFVGRLGHYETVQEAAE